MKEYYFKTEKLSVGYDGKPLIENVEFSLKKGEILTLIGPNGAGKSTILKSIAGQLALIGGTVYLGEQRVDSIGRAELARTMAAVWTGRMKTELMTCEDVVGMGRYPYTGRFGLLSREDHLAVQEAMELVHVTAIRDQDFTRISDGQRQRVMLARAICQEPEILILDEPTSYLDIRYKLEFLSTLQRMARKKNLTVILSLHELDLAARVSDRILCVNGRYVERFGEPQEIFQAGYLSRLFAIAEGSYDEENGGLELEAVKEGSRVFVIAGDGSGRNEYRRLQRQGQAFATGILYDNDLDYPVAKALAAEVIGTPGFEPVEEAARSRAKKCLEECERVICCRREFGTYDQANRELLEYARKCGKPVELRDGERKDQKQWQR